MASANAVQEGTGHTDLSAVGAMSEAPAQESSISTTTSTIPDDIQTPKVKTSSETVSHLECDVGPDVKLQLPTESGKYEATESETQETIQTHVSQEVDSYVDDRAEPDGYHPMILDVSRRSVGKDTELL